MVYIEAPFKITQGGHKSLFIAGSITDAPDWQKTLVDSLTDLDIVVLNPRRKNFPIDDPDASHGQIKWEHDALKKADAISFWFSKGTISPITLYELGAWEKTQKPIVIGIEPGYERENDVRIQTKLVRPDITIVSKLGDLTDEIFKLMNQIMSV